jgi:hypothetical protein
VTSDRNSQSMEFIKPKLVYSSGLSVSQDDGFANKLGLSPIEFGEDCAGSRLGDWHDVALMGEKRGPASHMKTRNSWRIHGNRMPKGNLSGGGGMPHRIFTISVPASVLRTTGAG